MPTQITVKPGAGAAIRALGATAINYCDQDFGKILTEAGGVDLILDMVGGSYIPRNIRSLAPDGRLVMIAFLEGPKVEQVIQRQQQGPAQGCRDRLLCRRQRRRKPV